MDTNHISSSLLGCWYVNHIINFSRNVCFFPLTHTEITILREITFEWERGKAVAESYRGQPCLSELNKITEIAVYTRGTRLEFYWRTSF
jgi:hypothetical protein